MYGVGQSTSLSRAELLALDPAAPNRPGENRSCCPLCGGEKRLDAAHRSLVWNATTGAYHCHRCKARGLLFEYHSKSDERTTLNHGKVRARSKLYALSVNVLTSPLQASHTCQTVTPAQNTAPVNQSLAEWRTALAGRLPLVKSPGERYLSDRGLPELALCGTGALPEPFVRRFAFRTVYAAFDADTAGDVAALALARQLAPVGVIVRRLRPVNGAKDWNESLQMNADALCCEILQFRTTHI